MISSRTSSLTKSNPRDNFHDESCRRDGGPPQTDGCSRRVSGNRWSDCFDSPCIGQTYCSSGYGGSHPGRPRQLDRVPPFCCSSTPPPSARATQPTPIPEHRAPHPPPPTQKNPPPAHPSP